MKLKQTQDGIPLETNSFMARMIYDDVCTMYTYELVIGTKKMHFDFAPNLMGFLSKAD